MKASNLPNRRSILAAITFILMASQMWIDRTSAATQIATDGQWVHLGFHSQVGTTPIRVGDIFVADPELTIVIPVGFEGVVDLTDIGCCTTERYSLTVDGTSMGETSVPSYEENFGGDMNDPDRGFSFSDWSSGTFIVGAGEHSLLVDTTEVGTLFTTWGAYIRVTLRAVGGGGGRQSYDQWDDDAFSAATPTSERAPDKNPDGDELNNAMEYLTGSDPEIETTESPFESGLDGGVFEVSYRRSKKVSAGA